MIRNKQHEQVSITISKHVLSQRYQDHTWGLMPPNQTILGVEFFEIEYLPLIQHIFSLILSCQNVILRSKNTVSKRDTPIQEYRVGTWHSDPIIHLVYPLLSPLSIHCYIIFIKPSLFKASLRLRVLQNIKSTVSGFQTNHKPHNQITQSHSQVHRELHNIIQGISITIKS